MFKKSSSSVKRGSYLCSYALYKKKFHSFTENKIKYMTGTFLYALLFYFLCCFHLKLLIRFPVSSFSYFRMHICHFFDCQVLIQIIFIFLRIAHLKCSFINSDLSIGWGLFIFDVHPEPYPGFEELSIF